MNNRGLIVGADFSEDQDGTPRIDLKQELKRYRKQAITAAKELLYGTVVIDDIKNAGSVGEIERILLTARKKMKD